MAVGSVAAQYWLMRLRSAGASALLAYGACLTALPIPTAAAQSVAPPSTASNWWIGLGAGNGTAGQTTDVGAVDASAWYSQGVLVGGVRTAALAPLINGDKSQDFAMLVGLRTPPSFAALIGAVGYSMASTTCDFAPCSAEYSPSASNAFAFSVQGRLNFNHVVLGVEVLGASGHGLNHFRATVLSVQFGSFRH